MVKNLTRLWWVAVVVAWLFDFLFWDKQAGISLPLYAVVLVAGGFVLARLEGVSHSWKSLLLLIPLVAFTVLMVIRREPMTVFLSVVASLWLLGLLAVSFTGGRWWEFSFINHIVNMILLAFSGVAGAIQFGIQRRKEEGSSDTGEEVAPQKKWKNAMPVVRGVLLATPVVLILIGLLSSADMVFASYVEDITELFRLEKLPEYIFRAIYIAIFAYLLVGIYGHALVKSDNSEMDSTEEKFNPKFLGFTESSIVLGSVDLLFAAFVFVQFRYFFGGQDNIRFDGFTFAEYARRGFGELVTVAVISIVLFLGLSAITRREHSRQRSIFSGMGILLVLLVGVMLVSAIQRLNLYEQAYGFTRLRMYPRVFMIWLGVLLSALVLLEIMGRQKRFALIFLTACLGYAVTIGVVNVDATIVHHNVGRALQGEELDYTYLLTLSSDSVPALWEEYNNHGLSETFKSDLGGVLACQAALAEELADERTWQSFHFSDWRARRILESQAAELEQYPVSEGEYGMYQVTINGETHHCRTWFID
jgi:hypothetical protein